eukprot:gene642-8145_t
MQRIVLYDGVCGLCNGVVQKVIYFDSSEKILFSPLQSKFSANLLKKKKLNNKDLDTFYYCEVDDLTNPKIIQLSSRFSGAFSLISSMSASSYLMLFLSYFLFFIPNFVGNFVYNLVGKNRYKIFGKYKEVCKMYSKYQMKRFIFDDLNDVNK